MFSPHGLKRVPCAAITTNKCAKDGTQVCSQCQLVSYCSGACQLAHWKKGHRDVCKSPYLKVNWMPQWLVKQRDPSFLAEEGQDPIHVSYGKRAHYIWGNILALDCLRAEANEGSITDRDLTLGFVASGDLRHFIRTVNALPSDYSGTCTVLLNDQDPVITSRNLMALIFLGGHLAGDLERDIELVFHLLYSAAVPARHATAVSLMTQRMFMMASRDLGHLQTYSYRHDTEDGRVGSVQAAFPTSVFAHLVAMGTSTYTWSEAQKAMTDTTLAPERLDYRERHWGGMSPAHRMSFIRYRSTGVVLPFGADLSAYTEPNRFMFTSKGEWLTTDSACPLYGWDPRDCVATGRKHGCTPGDIFGCFYFHVKDELAEFARRLRRFNLDVRITSNDAGALAGAIKARTDPFLAPFWPPRFDRVETSNMSDYEGVPRVLEWWAPLLNPANPHAAVLMYSMNWKIPRQKDLEDVILTHPALPRCLEANARAEEFARKYVKRSEAKNRGWCYSTGMPARFKFRETINAFYDNDQDFEGHLASTGFGSVARELGVRIRDANRVFPKRISFGFDANPAQLPPFGDEDIYLLGQFPSSVLGAAGRLTSTSFCERFFEFEAINLSDACLELD
ncbi:hypothetical protein PUNSTDRAFT_141704 [Punctularia strigosozonata HHB-11173 SS5]|uniref:uncharacterized protein n=1 Tax=Punctularia strigosozonata (strain HHB-11173) TaxID=741275 RepID=UPI000441708D|nr:uncharacterized protein PUNSTDRAFT_141704 [Punctularia strigosozonata HHB-11173 SS5]EIN11290.1 hypothetical protein PUNSTDRAFT_141704 [Punctularia strigosozonata HHB-11173 SS5]